MNDLDVYMEGRISVDVEINFLLQSDSVDESQVVGEEAFLKR